MASTIEPERSVSANPKDIVGIKKPPLHLAPMSAVFIMNQAMVDGAAKYGPYNWREHPVRAEVYYNAAMRHLNQWFHGEDVARDSGVHHLGHAMACMAILIDAEIEDTLINDRPKHRTPLDDLIEKLTKD
jgi:hypothetical protein